MVGGFLVCSHLDRDSASDGSHARQHNFCCRCCSQPFFFSLHRLKSWWCYSSDSFPPGFASFLDSCVHVRTDSRYWFCVNLLTLPWCRFEALARTIFMFVWLTWT
uniref:Uncharacterized protein n=1 Tax=Physcomitrium patens TaxID=3218 RepID=A0A2K1JXJ0_PHYPA|nr:hypothetical protein PHYPA_013364 [Physcomitrium patens]